MLTRWLIFPSTAYTFLIPWCGGTGICGEWSHDFMHASHVQNHDHDHDDHDHDHSDSHHTFELSAPQWIAFSAINSVVVSEFDWFRPGAIRATGNQPAPADSGAVFRAPPPAQAALCVFLT